MWEKGTSHFARSVARSIILRFLGKKVYQYCNKLKLRVDLLKRTDFGVRFFNFDLLTTLIFQV